MLNGQTNRCNDTVKILASNLPQDSIINERPKDVGKASILSESEWVVEYHNSIWVTLNSGATWERVFLSKKGDKNDQLIQALYFVDRYHGYLVKGDDFYATQNKGLKWSKLGRIFYESNVFYANGCFFIDTRTGWIVGSKYNKKKSIANRGPIYEGFILVTYDGGINWQEQSLRLSNSKFYHDKSWILRSVFVNKDRTGAAVGFPVAFFTKDGGAHWIQSKAHFNDFNFVKLLDDQYGWAIRRDGSEYAISRNGGEDWTMYPTNIPCNSDTVKIEFTTPRNALTVCSGLYRTKDAGRTWHKILYVKNGQERSFDYLFRATNRALVAIDIWHGQFHSIISKDNGETWIPQR